MVNSYTNSNITFGVNEILTFSNNKVLTGCTVTHAEGTGSFTLNKPGYYYLTFNADVSTSATAGEVIVQLFNNGAVVPGAIASEYSAVTGQDSNLAFSTIIRVLPSCCAIDNTATLTLQNTGVEAIFSNLNVVITKLC